MVRNITGALVEVGLRKIKPIDVKHILEAGERAGTHTAPACGLYLVNVHYNESDLLLDSQISV